MKDQSEYCCECPVDEKVNERRFSEPGAQIDRVHTSQEPPIICQLVPRLI